MIISSAGVTVVGKVRSNNEDNFYINGEYKRDCKQDAFALEDSRMMRNHLFAVCDGMGGYASGEVASLRALQILERYGSEGIASDMEGYVSEANRAVCNAMKSGSQTTTGTTLALMSISEGQASFCNVGDSRIYLVRGGLLKQISIDHTRAQSMINAGILDTKKAHGMKEGQILTQHLGIQESEFIICPEIIRGFQIESNDVFLLCSDGLTSMIDDEDLQRMIREDHNSPAKVIASRLTVEALRKGGKDNITVIIVKSE